MRVIIFYGLIILIVLGLVLSLFAYVRVPNDKMAFISGFRKRMVSGRLAFYVRAFERVDYLDLAVFSVDVDTKQFVPTNDFINIKADAIVKLQVGTAQEIMLIASKNFLNKNHEYMSNAIKDVLEGNLREIIGQMNLKDMVQNRKVFNQKVEENVIDGGEIFIANKILGDSSAKPFISGFVREKMEEAVQLTNVRNNIYGENVGMEFYFKKYNEMEQD